MTKAHSLSTEVFFEKSIIDTVKKAVHPVVRSTRGKIICLQVEYRDKLLADVANSVLTQLY